MLLVTVAAVLFVVPALIFLLELLLVVAIVAMGVAGRVLLGRPWTVEARARVAGDAVEWKVRGWRASGELLESVAAQLEATGKPTGGTSVGR